MRFHRSVVSAFVALMIVFGVGFATIPIVIAQLEIYLRKEAVPLAADLSTLPVPLGPWSRARDSEGRPIKDGIFGAEMIESLGTDKYLDRKYQSDGELLIVHVAYYTGMIDDVPHVPERCWDAAGLSQSMVATVFDVEVDYPGATTDGSPVNAATGRPYPRIESIDAVGNVVPVHLPIGNQGGIVQMTVTEFENVPGDPSSRQVGGYFFIANGRIAPSARDVRFMAFDPNEKYAYYCKVQLSYTGRLITGEPDDAVVQRFLQAAEDLLPRLIPEVMKCLPDWPSVEERTRREQSA
jgi:hypothetical protein